MIILNEQQQKGLELAMQGKSFVYVGSAGTGKTTSLQKILEAKIPRIGLFAESSKQIEEGTPSAVICSYMRTAVRNAEARIGKVATFCTIHKLLEFSPTIVSAFNEEGEIVSKKVFLPKRNAENKLPHIELLILDEAGTIPLRLFESLLEALPFPEKTQFVFIGDLFQLDPPYDSAILGYAMNTFPVVELTQVYRQALESPILRYAIAMKEGKKEEFSTLPITCGKELEIRPWKKKVDSFIAMRAIAGFLKQEFLAGNWNPRIDAVILPFGDGANSQNKEAHFGSRNLNREIAQFVGELHHREIHEIIAGFNKLYLAVGDEVRVNKEAGIIIRISRNYSYFGKIQPGTPSVNRDRFGGWIGKQEEKSDAELHAEIDALLAAAETSPTEALRNASHVVTVKLESGEEIELSATGDFSPQKFDFAYSMTCYKAQGQEWRNVYVIAHHTHAKMLTNEFFYTAMTRARSKLVIITDEKQIVKATELRSIPGLHWEEKAEYFRSEKKQATLQETPLAKSLFYKAKQEAGS